MFVKLSAETIIDLRATKVERVDDNAIWLYTMAGNLYMDNEAARELVIQLCKVLDATTTLPSLTDAELAAAMQVTP